MAGCSRRQRRVRANQTNLELDSPPRSARLAFQRCWQPGRDPGRGQYRQPGQPAPAAVGSGSWPRVLGPAQALQWLVRLRKMT